MIKDGSDTSSATISFPFLRSACCYSELRERESCLGSGSGEFDSRSKFLWESGGGNRPSEIRGRALLGGESVASVSLAVNASHHGLSVFPCPFQFTSASTNRSESIEQAWSTSSPLVNSLWNKAEGLNPLHPSMNSRNETSFKSNSLSILVSMACHWLDMVTMPPSTVNFESAPH